MSETIAVDDRLQKSMPLERPSLQESGPRTLGPRLQFPLDQRHASRIGHLLTVRLNDEENISCARTDRRDPRRADVEPEATQGAGLIVKQARTVPRVDLDNRRLGR